MESRGDFNSSLARAQNNQPESDAEARKMMRRRVGGEAAKKYLTVSPEDNERTNDFYGAAEETHESSNLSIGFKLNMPRVDQVLQNLGSAQT